MNTNQRVNEAYMRQYIKELESLVDDVKDISIKVLNDSMKKGLRYVKNGEGVQVTPVKYGHLRNSWFATKAQKTSNGVKSKLYNNKKYAPYVNYGHRVKNGKGETVGFIKGKFMLEKTSTEIEKALVKNFKKAIEDVKSKHGV